MTLREEVRIEALRLLNWWTDYLVDDRGGFYGEVDGDDNPLPDAPKSIILNTRLLWFFSAMAGWSGDARAITLAKRAADYIFLYFRDSSNEGLYWLLSPDGQPVDRRKQTYAQAFAVFAFAEYHGATGDATALTLARDLQALIEEKYWDAEYGGYIEALGADWQALPDQRLSEKDLNAPKTMNTHLHVLEAYSRLHGVAPTGETESALRRILTLFLDRFVADGHLRLFFDMDWNDLTRSVSYGHDIEASWLIWEAAKALGDAALLERARPVVFALAETARREGMSEAGAFSYERTFDGHTDPDGEWWEQAEAMVGFVNAWQMTGDASWLEAAEKVWADTKMQYGAGGPSEWTWYATTATREKIYKAGQWKCPYHNGRAMIELDRRLA